LEALEPPPTTALLTYIIAGQLRRDTILPPGGPPRLDVLGGSALYAAAGLRLWDDRAGVVARVGRDFPAVWLESLSCQHIDTRGIKILEEELDLRYFAAYPDAETRLTDNPIQHFARLGLPFPMDLMDYASKPVPIDSRTRLLPHTVRAADIPADYLDATAAHLCPLDFLTHTLLPSTMRQKRVQTITLDPGRGYMNPTFWDDIPAIAGGLTAFICSEEKLRSLFLGRSSDLWQMAETITGYGCELVVIKRGSKGQYLYDAPSHSRWIIPPYPAQVVDPTGAGDAFCGGFLAGYRRSYDPLRAALHGNVSASIIVQGSGPFYALDALPGLVQARLQMLSDMVRRA
jgi:sugar/nucleoside kinase (ribokinase family)